MSLFFPLFPQQLLKIFSDLFIATGISQSLKGFCFDLSNPLSTETELSSNLLKGALPIFSHSETEPKNLLFSWC